MVDVLLFFFVMSTDGLSNIDINKVKYLRQI